MRRLNTIKLILTIIILTAFVTFSNFSDVEAGKTPKIESASITSDGKLRFKTVDGATYYIVTIKGDSLIERFNEAYSRVELDELNEISGGYAEVDMNFMIQKMQSSRYEFKIPSATYTVYISGINLPENATLATWITPNYEAGTFYFNNPHKKPTASLSGSILTFNHVEGAEYYEILAWRSFKNVYCQCFYSIKAGTKEYENRRVDLNEVFKDKATDGNFNIYFYARGRENQSYTYREWCSEPVNLGTYNFDFGFRIKNAELSEDGIITLDELPLEFLDSYIVDIKDKNTGELVDNIHFNNNGMGDIVASDGVVSLNLKRRMRVPSGVYTLSIYAVRKLGGYTEEVELGDYSYVEKFDKTVTLKEINLDLSYWQSYRKESEDTNYAAAKVKSKKLTFDQSYKNYTIDDYLYVYEYTGKDDTNNQYSYDKVPYSEVLGENYRSYSYKTHYIAVRIQPKKRTEQIICDEKNLKYNVQFTGLENIDPKALPFFLDHVVKAPGYVELWFATRENSHPVTMNGVTTTGGIVRSDGSVYQTYFSKINPMYSIQNDLKDSDLGQWQITNSPLYTDSKCLKPLKTAPVEDKTYYFSIGFNIKERALLSGYITTFILDFSKLTAEKCDVSLDGYIVTFDHIEHEKIYFKAEKYLPPIYGKVTILDPNRNEKLMNGDKIAAKLEYFPSPIHFEWQVSPDKKTWTTVANESGLTFNTERWPKYWVRMRVTSSEYSGEILSNELYVDEMPVLQGKVAYSSGIVVGRKITLGFAGDLLKINNETPEKMHFQWQVSPNGYAGWTDIPDPEGKVRNYIPEDKYANKYIHVVVTVDRYKSGVISPSKQIQMTQNNDIPVRPELELGSKDKYENDDGVIVVKNKKNDQEYLWTYSSENPTEEEWNKKGVIMLGPEPEIAFSADEDRIVYVYTRFYETASRYAGTVVSYACIYNGVTIDLKGIDLNVTRVAGGEVMEQDDLGAYYIKPNDVLKIDAVPIPADATQYNGVRGNKWLMKESYPISSQYGDFYSDAECTTKIVADEYYKTVYYKARTMEPINHMQISAEYTKSSSEVYHSSFYINQGGGDGETEIYKIENLYIDNITIRKGETLEGIPFATRPAKAAVSSISLTKTSGEGTEPEITFDTDKREFSVNAENATPGTFSYSVSSGSANTFLQITVLSDYCTVTLSPNNGNPAENIEEKVKYGSSYMLPEFPDSFSKSAESEFGGWNIAQSGEPEIAQPYDTITIGEDMIIKVNWVNHEHHIVFVKGTAPTCMLPGCMDHYECDKCGKQFEDEEGTIEAATDDYFMIPATGHTPGTPEKEVKSPATCEMPGSYDEVIYCDICYEEISRTHFSEAPLGHTIVHVPAKEATCTEIGSTEEYWKCTRCGAMFGDENGTTSVNPSILIKMKPHTPGEKVKEDEVAATCETAGEYDEAVYCSVCNEELSREHKTVDALGHDWGEWTVTKEPTEKDKGIKTRVCKHDSSHKETAEIPATGKKDDKGQDSTQSPGKNPGQDSTQNADKNKGKTVPGVGTISKDGRILTDESGVRYRVSTEVKKTDLKKNLKIADKKNGGKYRITKLVKNKKTGKITGGTVEYMAPYNKNCTIISATGKVKLAGVTFTVTSIAPNCAKGCKKLTKVVLGDNITNIGKNAFNGCSKLKTINIKSTKLKKVGAGAFKGINKNASIKVPKAKKKAYTKLLKNKGQAKTVKIK
jgi:DNA-directed RNA polymerase subunit RPC12/RpoP